MHIYIYIYNNISLYREVVIHKMTSYKRIYTTLLTSRSRLT